MSAAGLPVGVVDSGFAERQRPWVVAARRFFLAADGQVQAGAAREDVIGHGSAVLDAIRTAAPGAAFSIAQVFDDRGATSAAQIAHALHWLLDERVRLINLSLGVRVDYPALRAACERVLNAGIIVLAASPARGAPVYPAAYPGVLRITGDARCAPGQWSWLDSAQADFGAIVRPQPGGPAGASLGCAAFCGLVAEWLTRHPQAGSAALRQHLQQQARYVGIERRRGPDND